MLAAVPAYVVGNGFVADGYSCTCVGFAAGHVAAPVMFDSLLRSPAAYRARGVAYARYTERHYTFSAFAANVLKILKG